MDPGPWIPIFAIAVGGLAILGRVIVQPIVHALMKMNEQRQAVPPVDVARLEQRLGALEDRLGGMERSVDRLLEDRDFYRQLNAGERPPR
ncbi:MAG TPA: hypothetical protein VK939_02280 [Longimicrobiales bacterium]|nr:hypothetical protein [Longimicrobiales bacterium]